MFLTHNLTHNYYKMPWNTSKILQEAQVATKMDCIVNISYFKIIIFISIKKMLMKKELNYATIQSSLFLLVVARMCGLLHSRCIFLKENILICVNYLCIFMIKQMKKIHKSITHTTLLGICNWCLFTLLVMMFNNYQERASHLAIKNKTVAEL